MNVGIVGFGSIGTEVAKALLEGVENFYLYGISSRSKTNAEERISKLKKSIEIFDLDTLINNCLKLQHQLSYNQSVFGD